LNLSVNGQEGRIRNSPNQFLIQAIMNGLNYFGFVLMGLGGLLLLWTLRALVQRRALLRDPVKVEGVVSGVRHVPASSTDSVGTSDPGQYFATVRYETEESETVEHELLPTHDASECEIGAVVQLLYQRGNPANVVYGDMPWGDIWSAVIGSLICLGIGALLCFCVHPTQAKSADGAISIKDRE
jgi:hypothetical protein